jgi:hypothetical protein
MPASAQPWADSFSAASPVSGSPPNFPRQSPHPQVSSLKPLKSRKSRKSLKSPVPTQLQDSDPRLPSSPTLPHPPAHSPPAQRSNSRQPGQRRAITPDARYSFPPPCCRRAAAVPSPPLPPLPPLVFLTTSRWPVLVMTNRFNKHQRFGAHAHPPPRCPPSRPQDFFRKPIPSSQPFGPPHARYSLATPRQLPHSCSQRRGDQRPRPWCSLTTSRMPTKSAFRRAKPEPQWSPTSHLCPIRRNHFWITSHSGR